MFISHLRRRGGGTPLVSVSAVACPAARRPALISQGAKRILRFRIPLLTTFVALSLLSPLPAPLFVSAKTPTHARPPARRTPSKMSDELQTRPREARAARRETA